jgi:hypothetical protein
MSVQDRRQLVERKPSALSIADMRLAGDCALCRVPAAANDNDLELMRRIDELFTA